MKISSILYRARQFWDALKNNPLLASDLAPAQSVLTDRQMALFNRLQPSEQVHGLRVLQTLQAQGESHPDLLVAALLHDIGKCRFPLRLWERAVIVLGKKFFPRGAKIWGRAAPQGWKRPFVVACEHPLWGAELAKKVGTSPLAVYLIREHQNQILAERSTTLEGRLLACLQRADNQN